MTEVARIQREYARREAQIPAGFYDLARPANYFAHCQLARRIVAMLDRGGLLPLEGRKIADIGCGTGNWLLEFVQWGARPGDLFGIDLNAGRIGLARTRIPGARLEAGDASRLSLPSGSFDLVCQFTAFSSVLDDSMRHSMASEMIRILKPSGALIWYDLRLGNPRNSAVAPIGKEVAQRLFPGCRIDVERVTLAPPLARLIAPRSWMLASFLERLPFLRSHNLMLIRKPA
jgi:ubiquinone/menaquinone biosynthesis C-methylase UbiE